MKITNDDIISAAKSLREKQDQKLTTPQNPLTAKTADGMLPSGVQPEVVREVVHDTIVETKFVIKEIVREVPVMAKNVTAEEKKPNNNNNNERGKTVGCSMMCDNISYDLIASKN